MRQGASCRFGSFRLDADARRLLHHGKPIHLTPKEFDLLSLLVANAGRVVSKDEILRTVWHDAAVEEGNLTQTVSLLRKVIGGEEAIDPIETVPRHGYIFRARVRPAGLLFFSCTGRIPVFWKAAAAALFLALWALLFYWLGASR